MRYLPSLPGLSVESPVVLASSTFHFEAKALCSYTFSFFIHPAPLLVKSLAASSGLASPPRKFEGSPNGFLDEIMEGRNFSEDS